LDVGGHRTVDNPYMSRSTIQVLSKRDPRVEPIAGVVLRHPDGTGELALDPTAVTRLA
jgi:hypothetical protein